MIHKIIVLVRYEDGVSKTLSIHTRDKKFTVEEFDKFTKKCSKLDKGEDVLYYTVRCKFESFGGIPDYKNNFRAQTVDGVVSVLGEIKERYYKCMES